ncbi:hypothetical protein IHV10_19810 [Fictibacillus sp. 5RED26]|uniref:hypothetical protein n=1 Tax=unclassified Fictibacillus TaxID=2644029 RepID=UPI0018CD4FEA|nr:MULTISPECIES: hypothetical protein [unclassified Fictibacillus]MBH0158634.1 hypothetical protein [Fictibacillus sp. 5RED26]MBH0175707.1 hypothetical protein [Fictibacillus sp. 23RED33]
MEKIFYHPTKFKGKNIPVFSSYYQYQTISYFLELSEKIEPSLIIDLEKMTALYATVEKIIDGSILDEWLKFEQANLINKDAIELRETLTNWAKKYNLYNDDN